MRLFTVIGALTGTATGFFLTIWTSLKWELVTGGKAPVSIPPFIIIAFELTILLGGLATALAVLILAQLPKLKPSPTYDPRFTRGPLRGRGRLRPRQGRLGAVGAVGRGRRGGAAMMKYVFLLTLLMFGAVGAALGGAAGFRWMNNMTATQRVMPGEYNFSMPPGSLPRSGGELYHSPAERDAAAARRNPVAGLGGFAAEGWRALHDLLHAVPRGVRAGRRAGLDQVRASRPTSPIPSCTRCARTATGRAISRRAAR